MAAPAENVGPDTVALVIDLKVVYRQRYSGELLRGIAADVL